MRLEALQDVVLLLWRSEPTVSESKRLIETAAQLISYLRLQVKSGYVHIENMALQLFQSAESAWL